MPKRRDTLQWLHYAIRNTYIAKVIKKKDMKRLKNTVPPHARSNFNKWLKSEVLRKQSAEKRETEIEKDFEITCSNPGCDVKEHGKSMLMKCDSCRFTRYCSRKCQKAHWKDHRKYC